MGFASGLGVFVDKSFWIDEEGAVEGLLAGGMDGVGLPVMGLKRSARSRRRGTADAPMPAP